VTYCNILLQIKDKNESRHDKTNKVCLRSMLFAISFSTYQGAGREVVAHLVQASELVANLTKWQTRRNFLKRVNEFLPGK
jgi:hypothetical protein